MGYVGRERKNQSPGRGKRKARVCLRREESAQGEGEAREGQMCLGQGRV